MVGQVGREHLVLVGGDQDVVVGRALGEDRQLRLHLDVAGIGAPGAAGVLEDPGLDDLRAELLRRAAVGVGERRVLRVRALDQEPAAPALEHQELRQRVGLHRPARRQVQQVRPAVGAAQPVVGGERVQHQHLRPGRVGHRQRRVGVGHGGDEADAFRHQALDGGHRLLGRDHPLGEGELLPHEAAGGVVVGDGEPGAREAEIVGRQVEPGDRPRPLVLDPDDRGRNRLGRRAPPPARASRPSGRAGTGMEYRIISVMFPPAQASGSGGRLATAKRSDHRHNLRRAAPRPRSRHALVSVSCSA